MMKGKNLTLKQVKTIRTMFNAGIHKKEIARTMSLGYSTVCQYIANKDKSPVSKAQKNYCVNVTKEEFDFVTEMAKEWDVTKQLAMTEIVRLAKRKCFFSWTF